MLLSRQKVQKNKREKTSDKQTKTKKKAITLSFLSFPFLSFPFGKKNLSLFCLLLSLTTQEKITISLSALLFAEEEEEEEEEERRGGGGSDGDDAWRRGGIGAKDSPRRGSNIPNRAQRHQPPHRSQTLEKSADWSDAHLVVPGTNKEARPAVRRSGR